MSDWRGKPFLVLLSQTQKSCLSLLLKEQSSVNPIHVSLHPPFCTFELESGQCGRLWRDRKESGASRGFEHFTKGRRGMPEQPNSPSYLRKVVT